MFPHNIVIRSVAPYSKKLAIFISLMLTITFPSKSFADNWGEDWGVMLWTCSGCDNDNDLTPDYLDADDDNDGLSDIVEAQLGTDALVFDDQSVPLVGIVMDSDSDGLTDEYELNVAGTDPNNITMVNTGSIPEQGDMNVDGDVNISDLLLLQQEIITPAL
jgi:hypothetical protein